MLRSDRNGVDVFDTLCQITREQGAGGGGGGGGGGGALHYTHVEYSVEFHLKNKGCRLVGQ